MLSNSVLCRRSGLTDARKFPDLEGRALFLVSAGDCQQRGPAVQVGFVSHQVVLLAAFLGEGRPTEVLVGDDEGLVEPIEGLELSGAAHIDLHLCFRRACRDRRVRAGATLVPLVKETLFALPNPLLRCRLVHLTL